MHVQNMIGKDFVNIVQRVLYGVLACQPDFIPAASNTVATESQEQMYAFIRDVTSSIFANPEQVNITPAPDDSYADWQVNNKKPDLIKLIRKTQKKVFGIYEFLYKLGMHGIVENNSISLSTSGMRITKSSLEMLNTFGILSDIRENNIVFTSKKYPHIFPGWKLLSQLCRESDSDTMFLFSRGVFVKQPESLVMMLSSFDKETEKQIIGLDKYLQDAGYEVKAQEDWEIWGITYYKDGERRFTIQYDVRKRNQMCYTLRLNKFKAFWRRFDTLDPNTRNMMVEMTKECSNCGLCKKIGIAAMGPFAAQIEGEDKLLCPWYPRSEWRYIDNEKVVGIRKLLELQEEILIRDTH